MVFIFISFFSYATCNATSNIEYLEFKTVTRYKEAYEKVSQTNKIAGFELPITDQEKYLLKKLQIPKNDSLRIENLNNIDNIEKEIYHFFSKTNNNLVSKNVTKIIIKLINILSSNGNKRHNILRIVVFNPDKLKDKFKLPRFHFDLNKAERKYKNIITLIGPSTLFLECKSESTYKQIIDDLKSPKSYSKLYINNKIQQFIKNDFCKQIQMPNNYVTIFPTAYFPNPTIHSEPYIDCPRLFISISVM